MTINVKTNIPYKPIKLIRDIKTFFISKLRLNILNKDTFSKEDKIIQNVRHSGDKYEHIPDFITKPDDNAGITVRKMIFSKEDEEKMATMTLEEMMNYKENLIKQGKYTYGLKQ